MKLLLTPFVLVLLTTAPINGLSQTRANTPELSNKDKAEILITVITNSLDEFMANHSFDQCLIPIVNGKKVLLINTELSLKSLFDVGDFSFRVKDSKEIEREIKSNDGTCYFSASLKVMNDNKATLSLWRHIDVIMNGRSNYPYRWSYGLGQTYEASRIKGKWSLKYLHKTELIT